VRLDLLFRPQAAQTLTPAMLPQSRKKSVAIEIINVNGIRGEKKREETRMRIQLAAKRTKGG
jgi:hypothetical protein